jgi:hypothetical protein
MAGDGGGTGYEGVARDGSDTGDPQFQDLDRVVGCGFHLDWELKPFAHADQFRD